MSMNIWVQFNGSGNNSLSNKNVIFRIKKTFKTLSIPGDQLVNTNWNVETKSWWFEYIYYLW